MGISFPSNSGSGTTRVAGPSESRSSRTVVTKSAESSATARDADERAMALQLESIEADIAAARTNTGLTGRMSFDTDLQTRFGGFVLHDFCNDLLTDRPPSGI
jgi:hypothetical protein